MRRLLARLTRLVRPCTLHTVVENGCYPYRCHVCGECFVCQHTQTTYQRGQHAWVCADGCIVPARNCPGVPTTGSDW